MQIGAPLYNKDKINLITKKKKKLPSRLGKIWMDTKQAIFFIWPYAIFSLIMQSDAARGQLCEIAPAHNIRSPVYTKNSVY